MGVTTSSSVSDITTTSLLALPDELLLKLAEFVIADPSEIPDSRWARRWPCHSDRNVLRLTHVCTRLRRVLIGKFYRHVHIPSLESLQLVTDIVSRSPPTAELVNTLTIVWVYTIKETVPTFKLWSKKKASKEKRPKQLQVRGMDSKTTSSKAGTITVQENQALNALPKLPNCTKLTLIMLTAPDELPHMLDILKFTSRCPGLVQLHINKLTGTMLEQSRAPSKLLVHAPKVPPFLIRLIVIFEGYNYGLKDHALLQNYCKPWMKSLFLEGFHTWAPASTYIASLGDVGEQLTDLTLYIRDGGEDDLQSSTLEWAAKAAPNLVSLRCHVTSGSRTPATLVTLSLRHLTDLFIYIRRGWQPTLFQKLGDGIKAKMFPALRQIIVITGTWDNAHKLSVAAQVGLIALCEETGITFTVEWYEAKEILHEDHFF